MDAQTYQIDSPEALDAAVLPRIVDGKDTNPIPHIIRADIRSAVVTLDRWDFTLIVRPDGGCQLDETADGVTRTLHYWKA